MCFNLSNNDDQHELTTQKLITRDQTSQLLEADDCDTTSVDDCDDSSDCCYSALDSASAFGYDFQLPAYSAVALEKEIFFKVNHSRFSSNTNRIKHEKRE
jgi:hypothetical protein